MCRFFLINQKYFVPLQPKEANYDNYEWADGRDSLAFRNAISGVHDVCAPLCVFNKV